MKARRRRRRGFTLIELLVVISIIGVLVGMLLPAINSAREAGRRAACQNNMRNVALALNGYATRFNAYPAAGTFFEFAAAAAPTATPSSSVLAVASSASTSAANAYAGRSWVVSILQDLDQADMANNWNNHTNYLGASTDAATTPNAVISRSALGILRCPDDTNFTPNEGNLSYVVNGGFARFAALPTVWSGLQADGATGGATSTPVVWNTADPMGLNAAGINQKLGVFFLNSVFDNIADNGASPAVMNGRSPSWGGLKTTTAAITDGSGSTIMLGESMLAGYSSGTAYSGGVEANWAAPWPGFCMFNGSDNVCEVGGMGSSGACATAFGSTYSNVADSTQWAYSNKVGTYENIGYGLVLSSASKGAFPFINSGHPNGANYAFCDGAVRFINNTIDGTVFSKIITPAGSKLPISPGGYKQLPVSQDAFVN